MKGASFRSHSFLCCLCPGPVCHLYVPILIKLEIEGVGMAVMLKGCLVDVKPGFDLIDVFYCLCYWGWAVGVLDDSDFNIG